MVVFIVTFSSQQQENVLWRQNECDSDALNLSIVKTFIELLNMENIKDFEIQEKQFHLPNFLADANADILHWTNIALV